MNPSENKPKNADVVETTRGLCHSNDRTIRSTGFRHLGHQFGKQSRDVHRGGGASGALPPPWSEFAPPPEIGPQKVLTDEYWVNSWEKRKKYAQKWVLSTHIPKIFAARFARRSCSCFLPHLGEISVIFGVKVVKKYQFSTLVFDEGKWFPHPCPPP